MTCGFCPEQGKEEITMEMQRPLRSRLGRGRQEFSFGPFEFEMPV